MKPLTRPLVASVCLALIGCSEPKPGSKAAGPLVAASPSPQVAETTEGEPDLIDVGPFTKEFEAAVPSLSPRSSVIAWADERHCCYKFGKKSNPLKIRCSNPSFPKKPFQLDVDFDDQDRYITKGVATDYMNWEKDSCQPG